MNFHKRKQKRISDNYIYTDSLITRSIYLSIMEIDKNLKETITTKLKKEFEGKCIVEGYIQKDSCQIVSYSSGLIKGVNIIYDVVFRCKTCFPVEGMNINCVAINITKSAGIRAEIEGMNPSPAVIFITRDHHYNDDNFSKIKEGDTFSATVIGQRFELNDKFISIIAKLIDSPHSHKKDETKPRFVLDEEVEISKPKISLNPKSIVNPTIITKPEQGSNIKTKIILEESDESSNEEEEEEIQRSLVNPPIITEPEQGSNIKAKIILEDSDEEED